MKDAPYIHNMEIPKSIRQHGIETILIYLFGMLTVFFSLPGLLDEYI